MLSLFTEYRLMPLEGAPIAAIMPSQGLHRTEEAL
jgi:hypothetical protein